jgi:hypothetical protein
VKYKSYDPNWCLDSKKIVYYLEKGDNHDQIWLTDINGSFHTNLTNDTTTHNYFPSWFDERTILYTQNPGALMMMMNDGSNKRKIKDMGADQAKYNAISKQFVYLTTESDNKVFLFDWKKKSSSVILDGTKMIKHF